MIIEIELIILLMNRSLSFLFLFFLISFGLWEKLFSCLDCILRFVAVEIKKREREWRRKRKEGKRKKYFFNSTGINLRRNNVCKIYSDCYSALQTWRATVANLKFFLEIERLLESWFCVNSGFSLQNLEMASPVGDALILFYI